MDTEEAKGYSAPGFARFAKWINAYVSTDYFAREVIIDEMFNAGFKARLEASLDGKVKMMPM